MANDYQKAKKEKKPRPPRKKGRRGPEKGGEFERWLCRTLTTWIDPTRVNGKPELFWRSATSGAKATQDTKAGLKANQGGDLIAVADEVLGTSHFWFTQLFSIEAKDRHDYGNLDLMFIDRGDFLKWWKKCQSDASRVNKVPLMVVKRYRREPLLVLPTWVGQTVGGLPGPDITVYGIDKTGFTIYLLDKWLEGTKIDRVFDLAYERKKQLDESYLASRKPERPRYLGKAKL